MHSLRLCPYTEIIENKDCKQVWSFIDFDYIMYFNNQTKHIWQCVVYRAKVVQGAH